MDEKRKCDHCGYAMDLDGHINSANAKYAIYICKSCGSKESKCLGVMQNA